MTEYLPEDNRTYKEKGYWDSRFDRWKPCCLCKFRNGLTVVPMPGCATARSRMTGWRATRTWPSCWPSTCVRQTAS
ncbi:hypothetical protein GQ600_10441 [Phytophthora cactorum]|nr:hypothetical protein GQ600_10441 [Phytophthora cactorum]